MKKILFLWVVGFCSIGCSTAYAQVKIGNNPTDLSPYAILELESETLSLLIPRMSLKQREQAFTAETPEGLIIYNTTTRTLEIFRGTDLGWEPILYHRDLPAPQQLVLEGNQLTLRPAGGTIDFSSYLDNTDAQTLQIVEDSLSISGGNSIPLTQIRETNTDRQELILANDALHISGGNSIPLDRIRDPNTDAQQLELERNILSITGGNSVTLAHLQDTNTDHQELALQGNILTISGGNSIEIPLTTRTDSQSLHLDNGVLSISNANSVTIPPPALVRISGVITNNTSATEDFVFGSTQLDNIVGLEDNARILFDKSKGAFRAGQSSTSEWDESNLGDKSIALGYRARAKGDRTFAVGDQARADADWSTAIGDEAHALGEISTAIGNEVIAESFKETVLGTNNWHPTGSDDSWNITDRLFTIGNGTSSNDLSDALVILKDGTTEINGVLTIDPQNDTTGYRFPKSRGVSGSLLSLQTSTGTSSWVTDLILPTPTNSRLIGIGVEGGHRGRLRISAASQDSQDNRWASSLDLHGNDHSVKGGDLDLVGGGREGAISLLTSDTLRMRITPSGMVGIGVQTPTTMLEVQGSITTQSDFFQRSTQLNVPDYVLETYVEGYSTQQPDYQRMSIQALERFIREYKHLPGFKNREEVLQKGGIELGKQVLLHWEKMEELVLYIIELQKDLDELKQRVETLEFNKYRL
ncbi:MAG: hypothetical protein ACPGC5_03940 [Flavobacteriaceae bacterium]